MTPRQIEMARHALGVNEPAARKKSYRNRYHVGSPSPDFTLWVALVERGFAGTRAQKPGDMMFCFYLSRQGAEAVLKKGETLDAEDFPT